MPKGIAIITWNNDTGAILVAKYPKNLKITTKLLTNIYANHRMNTTGPNFASLTLINTKIISFFSGIDDNQVVIPNYIIALLLRRNEKPLKFKEILKKGAAQILSNLQKENYEKIFENLFAEMTKIN